MQPSLTAYRAESGARWFDDFPQGSNTLEIEIRHEFSPRIILGYSHQTLRATHVGETAAYRCIGFLCGFFSESILSGLGSIEQIQYKVAENKLWIETPLSPFPLVQLHILGGVNLIEMNISVKNKLEGEYRDFIFPLAFIGLHFRFPVTNNISLAMNAKVQYLEVDRFKARALDASLGTRYQVSRRITLAGGLRNASWNLSSQTSTLINLKLSQHSPFLEFSVNY